VELEGGEVIEAENEVATVVGVAVSTDAADAGGAESADLSAVRTARR